MAEVTIEFGDVISGTGYAGITATTDTGKTFTPSAVDGLGTSVLTFTGDWLPGDIIAGEVATAHYDSVGNDYTDSDGKRLKTLEDISVNCLGSMYAPDFHVPLTEDLVDVAGGAIANFTRVGPIGYLNEWGKVVDVPEGSQRIGPTKGMWMGELRFNGIVSPEDLSAWAFVDGLQFAGSESIASINCQGLQTLNTDNVEHGARNQLSITIVNGNDAPMQVFAKAGTKSIIYIGARDDSNTDYAFQFYDLTGGGSLLGQLTSGTTIDILGGFIIPVDNGYLCDILMTHNSTDGVRRFTVGVADQDMVREFSADPADTLCYMGGVLAQPSGHELGNYSTYDVGSEDLEYPYTEYNSANDCTFLFEANQNREIVSNRCPISLGETGDNGQWFPLYRSNRLFRLSYWDAGAEELFRANTFEPLPLRARVALTCSTTTANMKLFVNGEEWPWNIHTDLDRTANTWDSTKMRVCMSANNTARFEEHLRDAVFFNRLMSDEDLKMLTTLQTYELPDEPELLP